MADSGPNSGVNNSSETILPDNVNLGDLTPTAEQSPNLEESIFTKPAEAAAPVGPAPAPENAPMAPAVPVEVPPAQPSVETITQAPEISNPVETNPAPVTQPAEVVPTQAPTPPTPETAPVQPQTPATPIAPAEPIDKLAEAEKPPVMDTQAASNLYKQVEELKPKE